MHQTLLRPQLKARVPPPTQVRGSLPRLMWRGISAAGMSLCVLVQAGLMPAAVCAETKPFVMVEMRGQLGNNLFQAATGCALAWDHGAEPVFPEMTHFANLQAHVFSRCNVDAPSNPIEAVWQERGMWYEPIDYRPNMLLKGYFQSEKYFVRHRERLLALLAPTERDARFIQKRYGNLLAHPKTVGIQVRWQFEDPDALTYPTYGRDYFARAMSFFPEDSLFIVSTNSLSFARDNVPIGGRNVVFLEGEPHYIELYILSMCKDNIISNSTFGWWSAWLNPRPEKKVIAPLLFSRHQGHDAYPEEWIRLPAKHGTLHDPSSYQ